MIPLTASSSTKKQSPIKPELAEGKSLLQVEVNCQAFENFINSHYKKLNYANF